MEKLKKVTPCNNIPSNWMGYYETQRKQFLGPFTQTVLEDVTYNHTEMIYPGSALIQYRFCQKQVAVGLILFIPSSDDIIEIKKSDKVLEDEYQDEKTTITMESESDSEKDIELRIVLCNFLPHELLRFRIMDNTGKDLIRIVLRPLECVKLHGTTENYHESYPIKITKKGKRWTEMYPVHPFLSRLNISLSAESNKYIRRLVSFQPGEKLPILVGGSSYGASSRRKEYMDQREWWRSFIEDKPFGSVPKNLNIPIASRQPEKLYPDLSSMLPTNPSAPPCEDIDYFMEQSVLLADYSDPMEQICFDTRTFKSEFESETKSVLFRVYNRPTSRVRFAYWQNANRFACFHDSYELKPTDSLIEKVQTMNCSCVQGQARYEFLLCLERTKCM